MKPFSFQTSSYSTHRFSFRKSHSLISVVRILSRRATRLKEGVNEEKSGHFGWFERVSDDGDWRELEKEKQRERIQR